MTATADDLPPGHGRRRVLLAVVILAVVVAAVVATRSPPVPAGTLGHVGAPPGLVADGPFPAGELALAWEDVLPGTSGPEVVALQEAGAPTILGGGLVVVDALVVDRATGETVGALPTGRRPVGVGSGNIAVLVDGQRVSHDGRTGEVVDRVPLTGVEGTPRFVSGALTDGTLVARAPGDGVFGSVLVARDGEVRPAIPPPVVDQLLHGAPGDEPRAWRATRVGSVFAVEVFPTDGSVDETPVRHLVDVATGALLGQLPDSSGFSLLVPAGDGVATAVDEQVLWAMGANGEVSELRLVEPDEVEGLRLLGAIDDRLVFAQRGDDGSWLLQHVPGPPWPSGTATTTTIGTVNPPARGQRSAPSMTSPPGIVKVNDATVTDDLVVVVDDDGSTIVARDLTGIERWRRPAAEGSLLSSAGDLVLVTEPSLEGTRATLLDGDGEEVWRDVTSGPRFAHVPQLVDGDAVYTTGTTFALDAVTGEPITDRGPRAPGPGEAPLAVIDDPDGVGAGVLAARRTGGADGTQVVTLGDEVVAELDAGEFANDLLVGIADGVLLVIERRVPSIDRVGIAAMVETSVLVQPDDTRIEVEGTLAFRYGLRTLEVGNIAVTSRDDGTALLDPTTGEPRFVLPEQVTLTDAGAGRLVAQQPSGWWVVDAVDGTTVGERREVLVHLLTVGDGLVAAAGIDGSLEVVRAADGQVVWRHEGATIAPTVVAFTGDHLLVGTRDGRVVEYDAAGDVVRTTEVGRGPVTSIAAAAGTLVVGVDDAVRGFRTDGDGLTTRDEVTVP